MYSALGWAGVARAIMESAKQGPIVQAASRAGIVIGVVCFGTEPFVMIKIVSGNSRGVERVELRPRSAAG